MMINYSFFFKILYELQFLIGLEVMERAYNYTLHKILLQFLLELRWIKLNSKS